MKVDFLGHIVDKGNIQNDKSKVKAITMWPLLQVSKLLAHSSTSLTTIGDLSKGSQKWWPYDKLIVKR